MFKKLQRGGLQGRPSGEAFRGGLQRGDFQRGDR